MLANCLTGGQAHEDAFNMRAELGEFARVAGPQL